MSAQRGVYDQQSHRLAVSLIGLVPSSAWFNPNETRKVVVQAFRVFRVPFEQMPYIPSTPLVIDFSQLRAVLGRAYHWLSVDPNLLHLFPTPDGHFAAFPDQVIWIGPSAQAFRHLTEEELYRSTGDAPLLLLITPVDKSAISGQQPLSQDASVVTGFEVDEVARERLTTARAAIVAALGRNAAFEELFELFLEFDFDQTNSTVQTKQIAVSPRRMSPMTFEAPRLDGFSAELAKQIYESLQSQDTDARSRFLLALRWYLLAQRHPLTKGELEVDVFLRYWIALESLVGPNVVVTSRRMLKELHGLENRSDQYVEDSLFPIGRLFGMRGKIVHHGHTPKMGHMLLKFMDDLFVDLLLHTLDVPTALKTDAYLDGSSITLIQDA